MKKIDGVFILFLSLQQLSNAAENPVAKLCQQNQPENNHRARHGLAVGACAKRIGFRNKSATEYEIRFKMQFNLSLSYSTKER